MDIERGDVIELRDSLKERAGIMRENSGKMDGWRSAALRGRAGGVEYACDLLNSLLAGNHAWREH